MKKTLLAILCFLAGILSTQAQILYGTTVRGGDFGGGTINKFLPAPNDLTVVKSFERENIASIQPIGNLVQATDGKFYGTARLTFPTFYEEAGIIFSFDPLSSSYTVQHYFDGYSSGIPIGGLMQASDGKLYGLTSIAAIAGNAGYMFSFDPVTSHYFKLHEFHDDNIGSPVGSLMQANNGKLYGMTIRGMFSFDPTAATFTKLKDLDYYKDGSFPSGNLLQASDGKLYGVTSQGGSSGRGVIFSYDPAVSVYTKLKDFDYNLGGNPSGTLIQAEDGKLYGTAGGGSNYRGLIYSFDPSASNYKELFNFNDINGAYPSGGLLLATDGNIYGTTTSGGANGNGVIFSFDVFTSVYTKLKDFFSTDGSIPSGSLIEASDGKLYGMTSEGGSNGYGVIFSFDTPTLSYAVLKDFEKHNNNNNESGSYPSGSVMQGSDGKLYGVTYAGGSKQYGVIYSLDPSTSTYTKLKDFNYTDGAYPVGHLLQAIDGKLYGMTFSGGNENGGVIFSFDLAASTYTKLTDLNFDEGSSPRGSLFQANDGKFYGMTSRGGSGYFGVIFSFDPQTLIYNRLYEFNGFSEGGSSDGMVQASDGKLYGMVGGGENEIGSLFSFDPSTSTYTTLKNFYGIDGFAPAGRLVSASNGLLYGTTSDGGSSSAGVIFSFDPVSSTYTRLKDFDWTNGAFPHGSLMQASDGKLYGMTYWGGRSSLGVIFSFDPSSATYSKLKDFDGVNGALPTWGSFIEVHDGINIAPVVNISSPVDDAIYPPPADILLTAEATDPDGKIKSVDFYNGGTLIFTEYNYPYSRKWIGVPLGDYTITAVATDDKELQTTSAPVHIHVVPDQPPVVSIASPADNASYLAPGVIPLTAEATDPVGKVKSVEFYNGSTLLFTEYNYPYSRKWMDVPAGVYILTAVATDDKGLTTTSAPVHVTVVTPVVSSLTLVDANTDKDLQPLYDGIILDNNTLPQSLNIRSNTAPKKVGSVVFILDGKKVRTENGFPYALAGDSPPGDYHAWSLPLGNHTLTAIPYAKYSGAGQEGVSLTVHFTVVDNQPITLAKKTPAEKDIAGEPLTVKVSPNPAHSILHVNINGQQNKKSRLCILSASGGAIKTLENIKSNRVEIDVSSLAGGTYFVKIVSGEKMVYKRFVKL